MIYTNVSDANCNMPCYGNTLDYIEFCGGEYYASVFPTGKNIWVSIRVFLIT